jgi:hypothetical protein
MSQLRRLSSAAKTSAGQGSWTPVMVPFNDRPSGMAESTA